MSTTFYIQRPPVEQAVYTVAEMAPHSPAPRLAAAGGGLCQRSQHSSDQRSRPLGPTCDVYQISTSEIPWHHMRLRPVVPQRQPPQSFADPTRMQYVRSAHREQYPLQPYGQPVECVSAHQLPAVPRGFSLVPACGGLFPVQATMSGATHVLMSLPQEERATTLPTDDGHPQFVNRALDYSNDPNRPFRFPTLPPPLPLEQFAEMVMINQCANVEGLQSRLKVERAGHVEGKWASDAEAQREAPSLSPDPATVLDNDAVREEYTHIMNLWYTQIVTICDRVHLTKHIIIPSPCPSFEQVRCQLQRTNRGGAVSPKEELMEWVSQCTTWWNDVLPATPDNSEAA